MYQCATDAVTVLYVRTGGKGAEEVTPDGVRERYGIDPAQVPDFIALRGDPSDGLPGAKGVGAEDRRRAAARARRRSRQLLDNAIREPRPKLRDALIGAREELLAFKDIATLRDAGVERPPDRPTDWEGRGEGGARTGHAQTRRAADRGGPPRMSAESRPSLL